jgi:G protein-coupled receptor 158
VDNQYSEPGMFECLQCAEGCESCEDDRPCVVSLNWVMRTAILILSCVIICCLPVVVLFTWKYGNVKVRQTSSLFFMKFFLHVGFGILTAEEMADERMYKIFPIL